MRISKIDGCIHMFILIRFLENVYVETAFFGFGGGLGLGLGLCLRRSFRFFWLSGQCHFIFVFLYVCTDTSYRTTGSHDTYVYIYHNFRLGLGCRGGLGCGLGSNPRVNPHPNTN